jgi:hypothetical protein
MGGQRVDKFVFISKTLIQVNGGRFISLVYFDFLFNYKKSI